MPRKPRARAESGIHHVVVQGARNKNIFVDEESKDLYLDILLQYKARFEMEVYAYCILENHGHILLKEGRIDVSSFMRRMGVSYSYWYRKRRQEEGAVFRGRYLSEPLEPQQLAAVVSYIHREPVKMGLAVQPEDYAWSSAHVYRSVHPFIETLPLVADPESPYDSFCPEEEMDCLEEVPAKYGKSRAEAEAAVRKRLGSLSLEELRCLEPEERNNLLRQLRYEEQISILLLSQITGIGRGVIQRIRR